MEEFNGLMIAAQPEPCEKVVTEDGKTWIIPYGYIIATAYNADFTEREVTFGVAGYVRFLKEKLSEAQTASIKETLKEAKAEEEEMLEELRNAFPPEAPTAESLERLWDRDSAEQKRYEEPTVLEISGLLGIDPSQLTMGDSAKPKGV